MPVANKKRPSVSAVGALGVSSTLRLEALALQPLAKQLPMTTYRLGFLSRLALRWLFIRAAQLHLAEYTLALHLLLKRFKGLVDIIVADCDVNDGISPTTLSLIKLKRLIS
ncbi:MAG: hypothetical protein CFH10_01239 [Alphaproteobacteria bacterium MarineAlpha4_Bin2]|nr:MAG: hypothetical protein CFH10_01239 [Alphaproteobacteria bacterium MarineAlpha4_Bin2]